MKDRNFLSRTIYAVGFLFSLVSFLLAPQSAFAAASVDHREEQLENPEKLALKLQQEKAKLAEANRGLTKQVSVLTQQVKFYAQEVASLRETLGDLLKPEANIGSTGLDSSQGVEVTKPGGKAPQQAQLQSSKAEYDLFSPDSPTSMIVPNFIPVKGSFSIGVFDTQDILDLLRTKDARIEELEKELAEQAMRSTRHEKASIEFVEFSKAYEEAAQLRLQTQVLMKEREHDDSTHVKLQEVHQRLVKEKQQSDEDRENLRAQLKKQREEFQLALEDHARKSEEQRKELEDLQTARLLDAEKLKQEAIKYAALIKEMAELQTQLEETQRSYQAIRKENEEDVPHFALDIAGQFDSEPLELTTLRISYQELLNEKQVSDREREKQNEEWMKQKRAIELAYAKEIENQRLDLAQKQEEIRGLMASLSQAQQRLSARHEEENEDLHSKKEELEALTGKLIRAEKGNTILKAGLGKLEGEVSELEALKRDLEDRLSDKEKQIKILTRDAIRLGAEFYALEKQYADLEDIYVALSNKYRDQSNKVIKMNETNSALEEEVEKLKVSLASYQRKTEELEVQNVSFITMKKELSLARENDDYLKSLVSKLGGKKEVLGQFVDMFIEFSKAPSSFALSKKSPPGSREVSDDDDDDE